MRVPYCVPRGPGTQLATIPVKDLPPLEPGKCQEQNQGSYLMPKGSHEMAAALLPVGILHAGNLLNNFGEDALSQLQETEI